MRPSFVLAAIFAVSASALSTHRIRHNHARHAMNVRAAVPAPVAEPLAEASAAKRRQRRTNGQCKKRPTSAAPSSTAASTPAATPAVPVNVAPAPASQPESSSKKAAPAPSPKPKPAPAPAPAAAAAPAPAAAPSSEGGARPFGDYFAGVNTGGDGTYYAPGLGACGWTNSDTDHIVAVPFGLWQNVPGFHSTNPNDNPVCGKAIDVSYQGSQPVRVTVVDECMGCNNNKSLDMSPAVFTMLAPMSVGRIHDIHWEWVN